MIARCGASTACTTSPPSPGPAQENLDFYAGVLGMRLVKRSVNQDDPGTYHLFYADAEGHPGTDLTFPLGADGAAAHGHGLAVEVGLEVPFGSLGFWARDSSATGHDRAAETRFGDSVLPVIDPHGLQLALVEATRRPRRSRRGREPGARRVPGSRAAQRAAVGARQHATVRFLTRCSASSRSGPRAAGRATASDGCGRRRRA